MKEQAALSALAAMSNKTRLRMVRALVVAGGDGLTAGEVAQAVGASPSRASFHLSVLVDAGLIASERTARQVTFRVRFDAIGGLALYLIEDCCGNNPTVRNCCFPNDTC